MKRALLSLALALALALAAPMPALAQDDNDIGYLRRQCMSVERWDRGTATRDDDAWGSWCLGYVRGVIDGADSYAFVNGDGLLCQRPMDAGQVRALFVGWANRHPEHWDRPASWGVISAVLEACPE